MESCHTTPCWWLHLPHTILTDNLHDTWNLVILHPADGSIFHTLYWQIIYMIHGILSYYTLLMAPSSTHHWQIIYMIHGILSYYTLLTGSIFHTPLTDNLHDTWNLVILHPADGSIFHTLYWQIIYMIHGFLSYYTLLTGSIFHIPLTDINLHDTWNLVILHPADWLHLLYTTHR